MASNGTERTLEETTRDLLDVLREIESAVEPPDPRGLIRPPTPRGFIEFTSEVGIPAAILVLRTNIAALELLQRSLRMLDDRPRDDAGGRQVRDRAADLTATSLGRLDDALGDLQRAVEAGAVDRSPGDLLEEARTRTEQLEAQLSDLEEAGVGGRSTASGADVDVEAELDSLRDSIDTADGAESGPPPANDS